MIFVFHERKKNKKGKVRGEGAEGEEEQEGGEGEGGANRLGVEVAKLARFGGLIDLLGIRAGLGY